MKMKDEYTVMKNCLTFNLWYSLTHNLYSRLWLVDEKNTYF